MSGWGLGAWGFSPWGGGADDELALLEAHAVRENCVRLSFSVPVRLLRDLAPRDGAILSKYAITADSSTTGLDGLPARPVRPAKAELALVENAGGALVDVWTDRPLSHHPSLYTVTVLDLFSTAGAPLALGSNTASFFGVQAAILAPHVDNVSVGTDLANPVNPNASIGSQIAGSYVVDASGDYAADKGLASYRKRVLRRIFTRKGAFAHLPSYGVGLLDRVKKLARPSDKASLLADIETQVKREPETKSCSPSLTLLDPSRGVWLLQIHATTSFGPTTSIAEQFVTGGA